MSGLPRLAPVALALAALLAAGALEAQTRYLAFGDSITAGVGDPDGGGYPARLEELLQARGVDAVVENHGLSGETTGEALSRINGVLNGGGDVLLLMEGTNDINGRVSPETIQFNLQEIARRAASRGIETVHATIVPRLPDANFDGENRVTARLNRLIRELAWQTDRDLADPFEVFRFQIDDFTALYVGGADKLHPAPSGYDLLAEVFADVLTDVDAVPPVTGLVFPEDDQQRVSPSAEIQVDLYDFGTGIAVTETELLVNGEVVPASLTGDQSRLQIRYRAPAPLVGVVFVGLRSRDQASPENVLDRNLVQFVVAGTRFLRGDIDRDGRVDGADLVAFGLRFGSRRGEGRYRAFADFNGDEVVDGADLAILASNFGQSAF